MSGSHVDSDARTARHRYFDLLMLDRTNGSLREFVLRERQKGRSWRHIAADVSRITKEDITDVTLGVWFGDDAEVAKAKGV